MKIMDTKDIISDIDLIVGCNREITNDSHMDLVDEVVEYIESKFNNVDLGNVRRLFINRMEDELKANETKGDWNTWKPNKDNALSELNHHLKKLTSALNRTNADEVSEYSADVSNICMKISEVHGCA